MAYTPKTQVTSQGVDEFLETVDEKRRAEAHALIEMMQRISGEEPKMWGPSMIGFGKYHYISKSKCEADWFKIGFSPRKAKISFYFSCDADGFADDLVELGKHIRGKGCIYANKLEDINMQTLEKITRYAYENTKDFDASKLGMTKPINTVSIEKATDKRWEQWVRELDESGARELSHTDLARVLYDQLNGSLENHGWWAQSITVAYEQQIGKRIPGQLASGLFELSVSRAAMASRDILFQSVVRWLEKQDKLNRSEPLKSRSSETPKRSTWRCDFADGSKFSATAEGNGEKSKLILSHTAIPTKQEADEWKDFWRSTAGQLV